ncbi:MAG TPA: PTS system mannose/fructose/sorbose family transporter subunit IID [Gemmatimonadaceae bacterium]|nr:PTS system mannose/fructose/sorbose family transporter subunit IID [Gemmatimonadaceae bacterium]
MISSPEPLPQGNVAGVPPELPPPRLPLRAWLTMYARLLTVQGAWNYESMMGTGIGFCTEPALRAMPGGRSGPAYHEALARESRYFNAHPYLAALAVGALARAELEGRPAAQIERFRAAMCGPLGSVGDRLVWGGWLPLSSLLALLVFGAGASGWLALATFLVVYNAGHLGLRAWALHTGWHHGLRVAAALGRPVLRQGPAHVSRAVALLAGAAVPLVLHRILAIGPALTAGAVAVGALGALALILLRGRLEGWRLAFAVLVALTLASVVL